MNIPESQQKTPLKLYFDDNSNDTCKIYFGSIYEFYPGFEGQPIEFSLIRFDEFDEIQYYVLRYFSGCKKRVLRTKSARSGR